MPSQFYGHCRATLGSDVLLVPGALVKGIAGRNNRRRHRLDTHAFLLGGKIMTDSLLIQGGTILTATKEQPVIENGFILIEKGQIAAIGPGRPKPEIDVDEVIDARDKLVIPGFVNAHTHLCMTLGRSLGTDRTLLQWLSLSQLPFMNQMTPEDYGLAVTLGAIENLKSGNTTVCEIFFSSRYDDGADEIAVAALAETGIRGLFFRCSNDEEFAPGFHEATIDISTRSQRLIETWRTDKRVHVGVGPIVPWSASENYWADTVDLVTNKAVPVHLHTAETPEYNDLISARSGKRNVEFLADIGALGPNVMLNHCVHLTPGDIDLIAEHGSPVIHDPTSNMILASGVSPVPEMRAAGITMGLACDGPACNNTQDMFEVMKDAALLHKVTRLDSGVLTAADVFAMATTGGAQAAGLGDSVGCLAPGRTADIVLVDTLSSHMRPLHDPMAALVYSARAADVDTVLVGGRVVVRNREILTVDEKSVIRRAQTRAEELRRSAGV